MIKNLSLIIFSSIHRKHEKMDSKLQIIIIETDPNDFKFQAKMRLRTGPGGIGLKK